MRTLRQDCGHGRAVFPILGLIAIAISLAGCASSPAVPPAEGGEAESAAAKGAPDARPEVLEIRGPVPLPVRIAALLPDPPGRLAAASLPAAAPFARPGAVSAQAAEVAPAQKPPVPPTAPEQKPSQPQAAASKPAAPAAAAPAKPAVKSPAPAGDAEKPAPEASARPAVVLPAAPASAARAAADAEPAATRSEEAVRGSPLELPFRGSGWVYLGETGGRDGIRYDTRKYDGSSAVFLFTAERAGEYQLRFQRQDPLSGEPENLLVKVTVREPEPKAPAASAAPVRGSTESKPGPAAEAPVSTPSAAETPVPAEPAGVSAPAPARELPSTPEALLRLAREDLAAARIASVLEVLDRYVSLFPFGSDEAWFLYAKAYEYNTPYRDIKKAYANYRKVRDEWPRSPFWKDASERVAYIERHYFDIR